MHNYVEKVYNTPTELLCNNKPVAGKHRPTFNDNVYFNNNIYFLCCIQK